MPAQKLIENYLLTAASLIKLYNGNIPLNYFLKQFFVRHKKYGSRDRKHIINICYCYYRLGHCLKDLQIDEKLKTAIFLINVEFDDLNIFLNDKYPELSSKELQERISFI